MHTIFWPRRRWISRFDATSALDVASLEGVARMRGNRARGAVESVRRLIIMRELVKRM